MINADIPAFTAELCKLQELLAAPELPESRMLLYFEALQDLDLTVVVAGLRAVGGRHRYPTLPKPVEIREAALGTGEDLAERGWQAMRRAMTQAGAYTSLVLTDAALAATITAVFDGWPGACLAEFSPEMWASKRKEFERVYRVMLERGLVGPVRLPGLVELRNGGNPDWQKYIPVADVEGYDVRLLEAPRRKALRPPEPDAPQKPTKKTAKSVMALVRNAVKGMGPRKAPHA